MARTLKATHLLDRNVPSAIIASKSDDLGIFTWSSVVIRMALMILRGCEKMVEVLELITQQLKELNVPDAAIESLISQIKRYGELLAELALEDAPNCDDCDHIDPDNPPERYNEGYQ